MKRYGRGKQQIKAESGSRMHKNSMIWLWRVSGRCKGAVAALMALQMVSGACSVMFALLLRDLIDEAMIKSRSGFFGTALALAALFLFQTGAGAFERFLGEWTWSTLVNRLKERLFSCLLRKDYTMVSAVHSGEWISRLTSDSGEVAGGILGIFPSLAGMAVRLTGAMAALFFLEPSLFCIMIPAGILFFAVASVFRKRMKSLHKKIQEANGTVISFLQERLENLMIIRVFAMEKQTCLEAGKRLEAYKDARIRRLHFSNFCSTGFELIMEGGYVAAALYCGYGILSGTLSYGTFTAVLQLFSQVQTPFTRISGIVSWYYAMQASAERLMEAEAFEDDGDGTYVSQEEIIRFYQTEFRGIGVRDASFSYERPENDGKSGPVVINCLNLEIEKGQYLAFTGHSGCGKSTLLKLLMCLYPLNGGERYLRKKDGTEILLTPAWRGLFAYVPQGNQLMSGTIREIVAFGAPEAMEEENRLKDALKIACADDFVEKLEHGVDTMLGERGCGLSEGQMQRIAIARALFSGRPILILDEATSSLDEATEKRLLLNLRQMTDKTVLIITHRPAALEICDRKIAMTREDA